MSEPDLTPDGGADPAAEYALGVLDGAERAAAERRYIADTTFGRDVDDWQARLAALVDTVPAEVPPAHVWSSIARHLQQSNVVELQLQRSVKTWRGVAAAASALAAALALVVVWPRPATPPAPVLTARLSATATGPTVFVALYDPARRAIVLTPAAVSETAGRSPELWLIPVGGKPVALGVAAFGSSVQLIPAADTSGVRSGTLAVSIEPKGGSRTGQPTGPVIATGQLAAL